MTNEAYWNGGCGHIWDIKLGAECPVCHPHYLRKFSAGVELGSRAADLDAALAEIERLRAELADVKRNAVARCNVVAICDDYEREAERLAHRLASVENEIAVLRDVVRIAAHQPPAS